MTVSKKTMSMDGRRMDDGRPHDDRKNHIWESCVALKKLLGYSIQWVTEKRLQTATTDIYICLLLQQVTFKHTSVTRTVTKEEYCNQTKLNRQPCIYMSQEVINLHIGNTAPTHIHTRFTHLTFLMTRPSIILLTEAFHICIKVHSLQ